MTTTAAWLSSLDEHLDDPGGAVDGPDRPDPALADPRLVRAAYRLGTAAVRRALYDTYHRVRAGEIGDGDVVAATVEGLPAGADGLQPVINASGVLLHPGLGRAVLSDAARTAVQRATGCTDVEFDLETGRRDRRGRSALAALIEAVPSAGSACVVNNHAAALALTATALAAGREIVVSRAELAALPDRFRMTELLGSTGARLVQVGTDDGATLTDYDRATWSGTGFVLAVPPTRSPGSAAAVEPHRLVSLGVPVVVAVRSGLLRPEAALPGEPDVETALAAGATAVTAGGDLLLGGPQAGLLLGDRAVVDQLRRHPLARAVRADKLTLAALEATLRGGVTPTIAAIRADVDVLRRRGEAVRTALRAGGVPADLVPVRTSVRDGAPPATALPSVAVGVPHDLARPLRRGRPAVLGRVRDGRLLLDLRPVPAGQDPALVTAVLAAAAAVREADEEGPRSA